MKLFIEVAHLGAGQSFGELALINGEPRSATIKCNSECLFATINKDEYERVLKKIETREIAKKMEFFMSLPFLKGQTINQVKRILPGFTLQTYFRNQVVFSEKDTPEHVYIVQNGEFEVSKMKLKRVKQSNERKLKALIGPAKQSSHQAIDEGYHWSKKSIRISLYCRGQIFGHEDVIPGRTHRTTVRCLSQDGALFVIHKDEFISKFHRDERIWNSLTKTGKDFDLRIQQIGKQTHFIASQFSPADRPQTVVQGQPTKPANNVQAHSLGCPQKPEVKQKKTIEMGTRNMIIQKYNMRRTQERLDDFRTTIKIIVDCKNGVYPKDVQEDRYPEYNCSADPLVLSPKSVSLQGKLADSTSRSKGRMLFSPQVKTHYNSKFT